MKFPKTGHEDDKMVRLCTVKGGVNVKEEIINVLGRKKAGSRSPPKHPE